MADDEQRQRVEQIEATVSSLEERITELEAELEARARRGGLSLRRHVTCPACGCREILHVGEVLDRNSSGGHKPLSVTQKGFFVERAVGQLELFVCVKCGFAEWYVKDPQAIEEKEGKVTKLSVAAKDDDGPYR